MSGTQQYTTAHVHASTYTKCEEVRQCYNTGLTKREGTCGSTANDVRCVDESIIGEWL